MKDIKIDYEKYSEDDFHDRLGKTKNNARSKLRPKSKELKTGFVVSVHRGRYELEVFENNNYHKLLSVKSSHLRNWKIVVGDIVNFEQTSDLARIIEIQARKNTLKRTIDDLKNAPERVFVSNVDQVVIVVSSSNPEPIYGFIDRCLVASLHEKITPIIWITKIDLKPETEIIDYYRETNVEIVSSNIDDFNIKNYLNIFLEKTSVFIGQSGVGKSTLLNLLTGLNIREIGDVNQVTGKGKHTSTSSICVRITEFDNHNFPTRVIDTPGVRSFGIGHIENIFTAFKDLELYLNNCPKHCDHKESNQNCELEKALKNNLLTTTQIKRIKSLRNLI